ncbi:MAG: type II secretion system major pseudopilin GspG [Acidiferrobacterales bacterium]
MNALFNVEARNARGFTLLELLVVLVILGLLAGLVAPRVMKHVGESKTKTARLQIEELGTALDVYRLELGRYPSNDDGLVALVQPPAGVDAWDGPYLRKRVVPKDPWGNDYRYRAPGEHGPYDLYSLGADNAEGGESENGDVLGWR